jgi:hypothetical protein|tara:strand:- start:3703 stop:3927 length:225 start_codon:yes stop_codon:yes gene_type:complete
MPTVDIEANIKKIQSNIEQMTQEVFKLQGMLNTFEGFKKGGLKTIDLPNDPNTEADQASSEPIEELESVQEKPE